MKTIFKLDQKVYDQVNFPNSEGTVTEIQRDVDGYWYVRVVFRGDDYFYHMDGTFGLCSIPTLSIKPYEDGVNDAYINAKEQFIDELRELRGDCDYE